MLLFNQLSGLLGYRQRKNQVFQPLPRLRFEDRILARLSDWSRSGRRRDGNGIQCTLKAIRKRVVILASFFRNGSLYGRTQSGSIAGRAGADNRQKEIASSHRRHVRTENH